MAVGEDDVRNLARLAHLELTEGEVAGLRRHLESLLGYVAQIQAIDVGDAPETVHVGLRATPLRPDAARKGIPREVIMALAPEAASGLFEVPRVIASRGPSPAADEADEIAP